MQAATCFVQPLYPSKSASFISSPSKTAISITNSSRASPIKAASSVPHEPLSVNYNSPFSVFPAEACDIVGGDACTAVMYPEAKLEKPSETNRNTVLEQFDREYFDYSSEPKSVLREEACEDLGGEFCEAPYLRD